MLEGYAATKLTQPFCEPCAREPATLSGYQSLPIMDVEAKRTTNEVEDISAHPQKNVEAVPLDFDDPHRAALEGNPDHAKKLSLLTILAVVVRRIFQSGMSSLR